MANKGGFVCLVSWLTGFGEGQTLRVLKCCVNAFEFSPEHYREPVRILAFQLHNHG